MHDDIDTGSTPQTHVHTDDDDHASGTQKPTKYIDPDERTPGRTGLNQSAEDIITANNFLGDL